MKKKTITETFYFSMYHLLAEQHRLSLDDAIRNIADSLSEYKGCQFKIDWDYDNTQLMVFKERPETDKEFQKRIRDTEKASAKRKKSTDTAKQARIQMLHKLMKEFPEEINKE